MIVYAFKWCDCVYESGSSVVSLHTTKKGAFKAMTAYANKRWQEERDSDLRYGYSSDIPLVHQRWCIAEYEVEEDY